MVATLIAVTGQLVKLSLGDWHQMLETHGQPGSIALDMLHEVGSEDLGAL